MRIQSAIQDFVKIAAGAIVMLVIILVARPFPGEHTPAEKVAFRARRADLVARMRLTLASASEAAKSAVLAVTDQDSQAYADQARVATAEVDRQRGELAGLLGSGGGQRERERLAQFTEGFAQLQTIDSELLSLAVKNTNLKAYELAFGPAADALKAMETALSRLVAESAAAPEARNVERLASDAQSAALRLQTLLAPHIAEESDPKMDEIEAQMTSLDQRVRKDLDGLAGLLKTGDHPDIQSAASQYARFSEIRSRILALSRENTNVRSLAIALGQRRKVLAVCQDALAALQQAIQDEPIPGANGESASNPRHLGLGCRASIPGQ
jgi:hypothetical protein